MTWMLVIIHIATTAAGTVTEVRKRPFAGPTACQRALDGSALAAGPGATIFAYCAEEKAAEANDG